MTDVRPDPNHPFHHVLYETDPPFSLTEYDTIDEGDWRYYIDIPVPCPVCGCTDACGYDNESRPYIHVEEPYND